MSRDEVSQRACDYWDSEQSSRESRGSKRFHWSLRGCCKEGAEVGVAGDTYRQPKPGVVMSETL